MKELSHRLGRLLLGGSLVLALGPAAAATAAAHGSIATAAGSGEPADFDIVETRLSTDGRNVVFAMTVRGTAGATRPSVTGALAGADVYSYVWPTSLDPVVVGFAPAAGILAFAVTIHPDFDDTPLFDENNDGDPSNDGVVWHSHWVVLVEDAACADGTLKVADIPAGATPPLPKTWPGLPLLIDSPGWSPVFAGPEVAVRVPFDDLGTVAAMQFDGVTAGLRVNESIHAPLLCVVRVFDVASGDLSLPGRLAP